MLVLEDGPRVVVETANQLGIELVRNLLCGQSFPDDAERLGAGRTEMIDDMRRLALQRLVLRVFRIKEAQWVLLEPGPAFLAEIGQVRSVILPQQLAIGRPADFIADAVQVQRDPGHLQGRKPVPSKRDGLDVEQRAAVTDRFDPELMQLTKASGLRPVVAEILTHVVEPHRLRFLVQTGIEVRPHDRGGSLRPQSQRPVATIGEGVHLLGDDVTPLPRAPNKEFGRLKDRGLDPLVTKARRLVLRGSLHRLPVRLLLGQEILCATCPLRDRSHGLEA